MKTTVPLTIAEIPPERDQLLIERGRQASIAQRLVALRDQVAENDRQLAAIQRERIAFAAVQHVPQAAPVVADQPLTFSDGTPVGPGERDEVARLGSATQYERLRA